MAPKIIIRFGSGTLFLFFAVVVIPFVYSTNVPDPSLSPRLAALALMNVVFLAFLFIGSRRTDGFDKVILKSPAVLFYSGYIMAGAVSVLFAVNVPEAIFEWLKSFVFFLFFFLSLACLYTDRRAVRDLIRFVAVFSLLISARGFFEIITVASGQQFDHQASYFVRAFSSNRNLYSQILFLTLPFIVTGILTLKKTWRFISAFATTAVIVLIVMLLTRSVWLALLISLTVAVIILVIYRRYFFLPDFSRILIRAVVPLIILIASALLIFSRFGDTEVFKKQLLWVENYKYGSSLERTDLWGKTLQMVSDRPVSGTGQGNWRIAVPAYGLEGMRSETGDTLFQRPHNDFLWVLSENGIFGFVFYLLLFAAVFYYGLRIISRSASRDERYLALLMVAGLAGYMVIAMLSFPKERVEHQVFLSLMMATVLARYHQMRSPSGEQKKNTTVIVFGFLFLLVAAVSAIAAVSRVYSEIHIGKGYNYRMRKEYRSVIDEMDKATTRFTTLDAFSTPLAWYRGEAQFILGMKEEALKSFEEAYKANPNHLHVLNNLGTTLELSGNRTLAKNYYSRALEISPRFSESLLNMCALLYNEKKYDSALIMLERVGDSIVSGRHERFLEAVLGRATLQVGKDTDDRLLAKAIERIGYDKSWMVKVFMKSLETGNPYKQELTEEAIYLLESVDSTINQERAAFYREKYLKLP